MLGFILLLLTADYIDLFTSEIYVKGYATFNSVQQFSDVDLILLKVNLNLTFLRLVTIFRLFKYFKKL